MSDYQPVKQAMEAGTPPELICAACPWDRLCITPPTMTGADVDRQMAEAKAKDTERTRAPGDSGMPVATLMTLLAVGGRDTQAQLCPVFTVKLRNPEGRYIADAIRASMRGEDGAVSNG